MEFVFPFPGAQSSRAGSPFLKAPSCPPPPPPHPRGSGGAARLGTASPLYPDRHDATATSCVGPGTCAGEHRALRGRRAAPPASTPCRGDIPAARHAHGDSRVLGGACLSGWAVRTERPSLVAPHDKEGPGTIMTLRQKVAMGCLKEEWRG